MSIFVATDQWVNSLLSYFGLNGTKIRIGQNAGLTNQGNNTVAIGTNAGQTLQGNNSIAIGQNAGQTNQSANSIVINATGAALSGNGGTSRCYIAPIRNDASKQNQVQYNSTSSEVSYVAQVVSPDTRLGLDITGDQNGLISDNAGGQNGRHLVIVINNQTYKIALLDP